MTITGGSLLAGGTSDASQSWDTNSDQLTKSKALRGTGQALFFVLMLFVYGCVFFALRRCFSSAASAEERSEHHILIILLLTFPFMTTRGIFGILQGVVNSLNVSTPSSASLSVISHRFLH